MDYISIRFCGGSWNGTTLVMTKAYEALWRRQFGGDHYDQPIQPTIFCYVNQLDVLESNIVKYISRHKNREKKEKGRGKQDIKKLIHYAEMILEMEYGE